MFKIALVDLVTSSVNLPPFIVWSLLFGLVRQSISSPFLPFWLRWSIPSNRPQNPVHSVVIHHRHFQSAVLPTRHLDSVSCLPLQHPSLSGSSARVSWLLIAPVQLVRLFRPASTDFISHQFVRPFGSCQLSSGSICPALLLVNWNSRLQSASSIFQRS